MRGLGMDYDVIAALQPVADVAAGANTGFRIHARNYANLGFFFYKAPASAGTDTVAIVLQEHNANTGGTSQNLAAITDFYTKTGASTNLAGTEAWVENTQAASATLSLAGATYAAKGLLVGFEIQASSLSAGFEWLSVNIADPGSGGTIPGALFVVGSDLQVQRNPALLAQPNA